MQMNKVAVNLAQDFTDAQQAQGRANIGASQISYDNAVTDMTVTKEVIRPYMNTKYAITVGTNSFLLLPSSFSDGMVIKSNGSLQTQSIPTYSNVITASFTGADSFTVPAGKKWTGMMGITITCSTAKTSTSMCGPIVNSTTIKTIWPEMSIGDVYAQTIPFEYDNTSSSSDTVIYFARSGILDTEVSTTFIGIEE